MHDVLRRRWVWATPDRKTWLAVQLPTGKTMSRVETTELKGEMIRLSQTPPGWCGGRSWWMLYTTVCDNGMVRINVHSHAVEVDDHVAETLGRKAAADAGAKGMERVEEPTEQLAAVVQWALRKHLLTIEQVQEAAAHWNILKREPEPVIAAVFKYGEIQIDQFAMNFRSALVGSLGNCKFPEPEVQNG